MKISLFIFCALFLLLTGNVAFGKPVILKANESLPYWSRTLPHNGLGGELIEAISRAGDVESIIEFVPLKRMIEDTTDNNLGNPVFYMDNQDFAAIIPIAITQVGLYYYNPLHDKKVTFKSLSDLKGFRVGALSGTMANRTIFEKAGILFETSYSQESLFKKLHHGRLDFVLELDLVGQQTIAKLFPTESKNFEVIALPKSVSPIAILLDKNYPNVENVANRYRQGLAKIIKDGSYNEIISSYYESHQLPLLWLKELERFSRLYQTTP
ncbi:MAG: transporter substrate-binding domain-containing protein [Methylococcales bacterium]|nr:transporter substrate-binding domain-containing protein [Methylococcales bacterium]